MDALDSALNPLKPALRAITTSLPSPIDNFALSLLGPKCHASLLQRLDVSTANSACLQLAVSKALGVAIISVASIVKIPQLMKLITSQSAEGLSFPSYLLETASFTISLAYSVRSAFPFSTYGESAFIAVQDIAIGALILLFSGRSAGAAAFIAGVAAVGYALFTPDVIDAANLKYLQAFGGVLGMASKIPQIYTIWSEGGTGQLSAFAVFNYLAGSLSRIFTTLAEVDDPQILYTFIAGFVANAILAAQMVYYWNSPSPKSGQKAKRDTMRVKEKTAMPVESGSGSGARAVPASAKKGPSTRRRG